MKDIPKAMIEAGARALQSSRMMQQYGHLATPEDWDESHDYIRENWMKHSEACLRAAMVGVEVVMQNNTDGSRFIYSHGTQSDPLAEVRKGDTLAVFRGGE